MSEQAFASGQCLCGDVKFTIASEPAMMGQCHCDDCRKSTGTGHASIAFFVKDNVKIDGKLSTYTSKADNGAGIKRSFCPNCGSSLFAESTDRDGVIGVLVGAIDDNSWFKANFRVYNKSKPAWDLMDDNIPAFEEMPPAA
ncbi:GFA family protein [sulfur-oxidizing endosymbiont of Gigantopelta aegis]|uniref:GFA family protein n=1 Tax=sulfur-oxidizing endosymbiont of Gigantopelta aegis TaxID=2794934 RepID=UPI0018DE2A37|nr:GFA family protein [sulfur-oxidizing endosymbiont of Gigantopelta aegis]